MLSRQHRRELERKPPFKWRLPNDKLAEFEGYIQRYVPNLKYRQLETNLPNTTEIVILAKDAFEHGEAGWTLITTLLIWFRPHAQFPMDYMRKK